MNSDSLKIKLSKFYSRKRKDQSQKEISEDSEDLYQPLLNKSLTIRSLRKAKKLNSVYLQKLEEEHDYMQQSILALTSHLARLQFGLRQILQSPTWERDRLLRDLEAVAFESAYKTTYDDIPTVYHDIHKISQIHKKRNRILKRLRAQLAKLYNRKQNQC